MVRGEREEVAVGEIGDCNGCGQSNVPVRFLKLPSEEFGWKYCRDCWESVKGQYQDEIGEPAPEFDE